MTKKKSRNGVISLYKFIASVLIVIYHGGALVGTSKFAISTIGYILVDFFFIVSGYFFYQSVLKFKKKKTLNIYKENVRFIIGKIKKFLPYTIISGIISIIIFYLLKVLKLSNVLMSGFNIFLIDMTGLTGYTINGPIWYISSMLIVFFVLLPVVYKLEDKYIYYICPIIVLFGLGYMYKNYSTLNLFRSHWNSLFLSGTLKAFVEINLGIIVCNLVPLIKKYNETNKKYKKASIVAYSSLFIIFTLIVLFYRRIGAVDYFLLTVITFALTLCFADETMSVKFDTKIIRYLEKLSLPIFVNQQLFLNLFSLAGKTFLKPFYLYLIIYVASTIIFSIIEQLIIDFFTNDKKTKKTLKASWYE